MASNDLKDLKDQVLYALIFSFSLDLADYIFWQSYE